MEREELTQPQLRELSRKTEGAKEAMTTIQALKIIVTPPTVPIVLLTGSKQMQHVQPSAATPSFIQVKYSGSQREGTDESQPKSDTKGLSEFLRKQRGRGRRSSGRGDVGIQLESIF